MTMTLHGFALSGHAHRAALFASLIGADVEVLETDLRGGAHKRPEFLALNPFGQVPVLVDGDAVIPDSNAILVYLAKKLGQTDWLPEDPAGAAEVQRWLSVAAGPIAFGPAAARLVTVFGAKLNAAETIARAEAVLGHVERRLTCRDWLAAERPTIADVALYSYIARAPEGNVDLAPFPAVRAWLSRVEALPGFRPMPRTRAGLEMLEDAR
jgi:glutathione S-transferase